MTAVRPTNLTWQANALCAEADPEVFYPEFGQSAAAARAICRSCPVVAECLSYALRNGERHGVWGGMTEHERRGLLVKRGRSAEVVCRKGLHALVGGNLHVDGSGIRRCVPCRAASARAARERCNAARKDRRQQARDAAATISTPGRKAA